jgi:hypothetical protein
VFLEKKNESVTIEYTYGGEETREVDIFHCSKKEHFLYTPQNEHKGNYFETETAENKPMPKSCEIFENTQDEWNSMIFGKL